VVTCDRDDMEWKEMPAFLRGDQDEVEAIELAEWFILGKLGRARTRKRVSNC